MKKLVLILILVIISTPVLSENHNQKDHPIIFLGNKNIPPMMYYEDDVLKGIVVDIANEIAKRIKDPVKIIGMDWAKAQQMVLEGNAHALLQINSSPERKKIYDFSLPLLSSEFSIFVSKKCQTISHFNDLRGRIVGVEKNGFPISILKKDPLIKIKIVPNSLKGFSLLSQGMIDAVVVDSWVGLFILAENQIRGIKMIPQPIEESNSCIAVKKGNTDLLSKINHALDDIKADGTYDEILKGWGAKEVIFITKAQYEKRTFWLFSILGAFFISLFWIMFLFLEIKKRKKLEEELQRAQKVARIGSWTLNLQTNELFWSKETYSIFRIEPDTPITMSLFVEYIYPDDREFVFSAWKGALSGKAYNIEHRILSGNEIKWVHERAEIIFDINNKPVSGIGTVQDITDRKKLEQKIQDGLSLNQIIVTNSNMGIMAYHNNGKCILGNQSAASIVGATLEQIMAQNFHEIESWKKSKLYDSALQVLTNGQLQKVQVSVKSTFGKVLNLECTLSQIIWNEEPHLILLINDLTELKKTEALLKKKNLDLEQSNSELQDFAYIASHDLQAPLRKILTFGDLLKEEEYNNLSDDGKHYIDRMQKSTERMKQFIEDLLSLSRITTRSSPFKPVNLNECINEVLFNIEFQIKKSNAKIIVDDLPEIYAEFFHMVQLFQNLIQNAIKFQAGDTAPEVRISSSLVKDSEFLEIKVQDNGIGFDEQHLKKIFQPFQRLHGKNEYKGTGMGLAICKKIITRHNGALTATSSPGKGACFYINLPVKHQEKEDGDE